MKRRKSIHAPTNYSFSWVDLLAIGCFQANLYVEKMINSKFASTFCKHGHIGSMFLLV